MIFIVRAVVGFAPVAQAAVEFVSAESAQFDCATFVFDGVESSPAVFVPHEIVVVEFAPATFVPLATAAVGFAPALPVPAAFALLVFAVVESVPVAFVPLVFAAVEPALAVFVPPVIVAVGSAPAEPAHVGCVVESVAAAYWDHAYRVVLFQEPAHSAAAVVLFQPASQGMVLLSDYQAKPLLP